MNKKLGRLLATQAWVFLVLMGAFVVAAVLLKQYLLAAGEAVVVALSVLFYMVRRRARKQQMQKFLDGVTASHTDIQGSENPFPVMVIRMSDCAVMYTNKAFQEASGEGEQMRDRAAEDLVPGLRTDWLMAGKTECPYDVTMRNRRFRVSGVTVKANDPAQTLMGVLYFSDLTELFQVRDEYVRSRPVVSLILIDNYEELTKNMSDSAMSALNANINEGITHWAEEYHGLLRRLSRNRYLLVFEKNDMLDAAEKKFTILEDIHKITSPSGIPVSISFGLGVDGATYEECYSFAALAAEMALSRGGDQAVIKDRYNFAFYGGRTKETERRGKVRSRVTANSMMELIGQSSQVFVMGHKNADLDSVGAAMGICCLCRKKGKKFSIVLDENRNAASQLVEQIKAVPEYKDAIVSGQEAILMCDNHSILVVVDTNRPDQVESKNLLEAISKVCVVDHHRRAADYINPVVVNLHEPYASSASELATEMLEYAVEKADVLPIEAKSLLAGIFLDTKSFHVRTGERTFEAAAYLRQLGADPVEVKQLLQNDFQDTIAKYQIIKSARLYRQELAIAALNGPTTRVLAAQAADELLNISGITASFVLYPDGDQVILSARSIGTANVQVILEALGGGGNAATAGAQVKESTVKEVLDRLVASIDRFYET